MVVSVNYTTSNAELPRHDITSYSCTYHPEEGHMIGTKHVGDHYRIKKYIHRTKVHLLVL